MGRVDASMAGYLHTYEAYCIPKGTKVKNAAGEEVVLSADEDKLVLTEKAGKQLVKDRFDYSGVLQARAEMAAQRTQSAATEKIVKDQAKALAVFRSMSNGDNVPPSDESKLMEYDDKLYQAAKIAQALAQMAEEKAENKDSEWDEKEEKEHREKMEKLTQESDEAALGIAKNYKAFSDAQKQNIVPIDSSGVDFSAIKVVSLGAGVSGANIDLSV